MASKTVKLVSSRTFQDIGTIGQTTAQLAGNMQSVNEILDVGLRNTGNIIDAFFRVSDMVALGFITINGNVATASIAAAVAPVTADSVQGSGSTASPIQLVGDTATPGNGYYYGTNGSGTKGWYTLPAGVAPANPISLVGTSAISGSASTYMRSDGAPAINQAMTPIWTGQHNWTQTTGTVAIVINGTGAALPAPFADTQIQLCSPTGTATRIMMDAVASNASLNFRRANGTPGSLTALLNGQVFGGFSAIGYGTSTFPTGASAGVQFITNENWSNTANGSLINFLTTLNGTLVESTVAKMYQGLTMQGATGGDQGLGTINATNLFINGVAVSGGGGGGPTNITPDTHSGTPAFPATDYFEGASLDTTGARFSGATAWTWYNQGSSTLTLSQGAAKYTGIVSASEDVSFIAQPMAVTGGNGRWRAKISVLLQQAYNNAGMYLYEIGTGKILQFGLVNFNGTFEMWVEYAAGFTAGGAIASNASMPGLWPLGGTTASVPVWLEIELTGGTLYFRYSLTGYDGSFTQFYTAAATSFFTTAPDHIGIGGYSFNGSQATIVYCDTFVQEA